MRPPQRCYICGVELVPVPGGHTGRLIDNHATRDHVPPDGIFCEPKPSNLITVPCCHKHNRMHSGVDERLRMISAMELARNEGGERILREKVLGSTLKKLRQPDFLAGIVKSMRDETWITPSGSIPVCAFTVSGREIHECIADITKGLLAHFYPDFDYHGHHFMVLDFHTATFAKGDTGRQIEVIRDMIARTCGDHRGTFNEFRFWRQVDPKLQSGSWLLMLYEAVMFSVIHTPRPIEEMLRD